MIVELIRLEEDSKYGTFGVLKINKKVFCVTLEPSDTGNRVGLSSIPDGQYDCVKFNSPKFGETYEVVYVPGRTLILFHAGNIVSHTKGCILLAQYFGKLRGDRAILNSGATFKNFIKTATDMNSFHLTISTHY